MVRGFSFFFFFWVGSEWGWGWGGWQAACILVLTYQTLEMKPLRTCDWAVIIIAPFFGSFLFQCWSVSSTEKSRSHFKGPGSSQSCNPSLVSCLIRQGEGERSLPTDLSPGGIEAQLGLAENVSRTVARAERWSFLFSWSGRNLSELEGVCAAAWIRWMTWFIVLVCSISSFKQILFFCIHLWFLAHFTVHMQRLHITGE